MVAGWSHSPSLPKHSSGSGCPLHFSGVDVVMVVREGVAVVKVELLDEVDEEVSVLVVEVLLVVIVDIVVSELLEVEVNVSDVDVFDVDDSDVEVFDVELVEEVVTVV